MQNTQDPDLYEVLQLSPHAEQPTIECVYRFLAMRASATLKKSQDPAKAQLVMKAYEALKDPVKRAAYDAERAGAQSVAALAEAVKTSSPRPAMGPALPKDVSEAKTRERRKRQLILDALYERKLATPTKPGVSLIELEKIIQVPKEEMDFALWYLIESGWVQSMDNGKVGITLPGVYAAEGVAVTAAPAPPAPDTEADTVSSKSP